MGTEDRRLEDTDRDAWRAVKEWLAKDQSGRVLLDHLRVDPEAGVRALAERLRGADAPTLASILVSGGNIGKLVAIARAERVSIAEPAAAVAAPHQLLSDVALFTGRGAELNRLRALLPEGTAATVVISAIAGTAGVGKTALTLHLAHELVPRFGDLQLFVNLHGYDSRQRLLPGEVLDRFLRALGVAPEALPTDGPLLVFARKFTVGLIWTQEPSSR
jgi:hypothetical protein